MGRGGRARVRGLFYSEEAVKRMRETVAELKRLVLQKIEVPADGDDGAG
jgi:hypothetical protein